MRWLEHLPRSGIPRLRALFTTHAGYSDLTPTQYEAALRWLDSADLLEDPSSSSGSAAVRVLRAAIAHSDTFWFKDADSFVRSVDDLPRDLMSAAEALGLGPNEAFDELGAAWTKVDTEARSRVGAAGEHALVDLLKRSTAATVEHVALWSDGYGFDIVVRAAGRRGHLEVKSTTRRERLTIFLSRNEFETMRRDRNWVLVLVRLSQDLDIEGIATLPTEWIAQHAPSDRTSYGSWQSVRLEIPRCVTLPGILPIADMLADMTDSVIRGKGW